MVKVLVVDDEAIIREGIIKSIDWEEYGISIAGEASNGREALKVAEDTKPDIVIADIRMPVMDGLEFSRHVRKLLPSVKLIILTGFGEFDYAREAIDLKVSEFILKPAGAGELVKVVLRLRDEILCEHEKEEAEKSHERLLKENLPVIQGKLIQRLVCAYYSDTGRDEFFRAAGKLKLDLSGPDYQVFIIAIDDYFFNVGGKSPGNRELILESVLNISREAVESYTKGYIYRNELGLFVGMANTGLHTYSTDAMCRQIQYLIGRHLKLSVSIGIGNVKNDIFRVHESYNEAFNALRSRFYEGKKAIIHINDVQKGNGQGQISMQSCVEEEKEFLMCLRLIDRDGAGHVIERIFERFMSVKADYSNIKNISLNLLLASLKEIQDMGIDIEERFEGSFDPFLEIERYETAEDIKKWMSVVTGKLIDIVENEKNEKYKSIVKKALEYMTKHYNEPVSLKVMAGNVHVTPNYFSRVFKEETGESFIEWLNKFRIEKAKELLSDSTLKTYEVAERVGFNDYKHFSYNFKKYMGCSLTEYKDRIF